MKGISTIFTSYLYQVFLEGVFYPYLLPSQYTPIEVSYGN